MLAFSTMSDDFGDISQTILYLSVVRLWISEEYFSRFSGTLFLYYGKPILTRFRSCLDICSKQTIIEIAYFQLCVFTRCFRAPGDVQPCEVFLLAERFELWLPHPIVPVSIALSKVPLPSSLVKLSVRSQNDIVNLIKRGNVEADRLAKYEKQIIMCAVTKGILGNKPFDVLWEAGSPKIPML